MTLPDNHWPTIEELIPILVDLSPSRSTTITDLVSTCNIKFLESDLMMMPNGKFRAVFEITRDADFIRNIKLYNATSVTQVKLYMGEMVVWSEEFLPCGSNEIEIGFPDVYIAAYLIAFNHILVEVETTSDKSVRLAWEATNLNYPENLIMNYIFHKLTEIYVPCYNFVIKWGQVFPLHTLTDTNQNSTSVRMIQEKKEILSDY